MTFGDWLNTWLELYVSPSKLAPSTIACYNRAVAAVPAALARLDLHDLTPILLQKWIVTVARQHPRAAQLDRVMLVRALRCASKAGLAPGLILDQDTLPKPAHAPKEAAVLALDEVRRYLVEAKTSTCYPLLCFCLCGLRRGEALGVRWEDVSQDGILSIRRQRQRINGRYVSRPLKTGHSMRQLQLPEQVQQALATWPRSITGWIVDTTPEHLQHEHKAVLTRAVLPNVTLHGLRHTFATQAAAEGVTMKLLQVAMGHAQMSLTADLYADHLSPLSSLPAQVWQCFAG